MISKYFEDDNKLLELLEKLYQNQEITEQLIIELNTLISTHLDLFKLQSSKLLVISKKIIQFLFSRNFIISKSDLSPSFRYYFPNPKKLNIEKKIKEEFFDNFYKLISNVFSVNEININRLSKYFSINDYSSLFKFLMIWEDIFYEFPEEKILEIRTIFYKKDIYIYFKKEFFDLIFGPKGIIKKDKLSLEDFLRQLMLPMNLKLSLYRWKRGHFFPLSFLQQLLSSKYYNLFKNYFKNIEYLRIGKSPQRILKPVLYEMREKYHSLIKFIPITSNLGFVLKRHRDLGVIMTKVDFNIFKKNFNQKLEIVTPYYQNLLEKIKFYKQELFESNNTEVPITAYSKLSINQYNKQDLFESYRNNFYSTEEFNNSEILNLVKDIGEKFINFNEEIYIKSLKLENFKCFEHYFIEFNKGINIIYGQSGSGKSTIIEAILYLLNIIQSKDLIRFNEKSCKVELELIKGNRNLKIRRESSKHEKDFICFNENEIDVNHELKEIYSNYGLLFKETDILFNLSTFFNIVDNKNMLKSPIYSERGYNGLEPKDRNPHDKKYLNDRFLINVIKKQTKIRKYFLNNHYFEFISWFLGVIGEILKINDGLFEFFEPHEKFNNDPYLMDFFKALKNYDYDDNDYWKNNYRFYHNISIISRENNRFLIINYLLHVILIFLHPKSILSQENYSSAKNRFHKKIFRYNSLENMLISLRDRIRDLNIEKELSKITPLEKEILDLLSFLLTLLIKTPIFSESEKKSILKKIDEEIIKKALIKIPSYRIKELSNGIEIFGVFFEYNDKFRMLKEILKNIAIFYKMKSILSLFKTNQFIESLEKFEDDIYKKNLKKVYLYFNTATQNIFKSDGLELSMNWNGKFELRKEKNHKIKLSMLSMREKFKLVLCIESVLSSFISNSFYLMDDIDKLLNPNDFETMFDFFSNIFNQRQLIICTSNEKFINFQPASHVSITTPSELPLMKTKTKQYHPHISKELIEILINTTLKPLVEQKLRKISESIQERESAILGLKILDPACNDGSILLNVAHFLAKLLAELRTNPKNPKESDLLVARKDIIENCLYGVDVNLDSINVAKQKLLNSINIKEKSLESLDNHLKCGNSLIGLIKRKKIDEIKVHAFNAIKGNGAVGIEDENRSLQNEAREIIRHEIKEISYILKNKKILPIELEKESKYQQALKEADIWTSTFFWSLEGKELGAIPSHALIAELRNNKNNEWIHEIMQKISKISENFQFFHWFNEFPEIFSSDKMGFDCILTKPPWDELRFNEEEFFRELKSEGFHLAENKERRKAFIKALKYKNPKLHVSYEKAWKDIKKTEHFIKSSGIYDLSSKGNPSYSILYTERCLDLINSEGYIGSCIPTSIITGHYSRDLIAYLVQNNFLVSIHDFNNKNELLDNVNKRVNFCFITLSGKKAVSEKLLSSFQNVDPKEFNKILAQFYGNQRNLEEMIQDLPFDYKLIPINQKDFEFFNPNTFDFPQFEFFGDLKITRHINNQSEILIKRDENYSVVKNSWELNIVAIHPLQNKDKLLEISKRKWHLNIKRWLSRNRNERLLIASIQKIEGLKRPIYKVKTDNNIKDICCLLANMNSIIIEYCFFEKCLTNININRNLIEQLPIFPPSRYTEELKNLILPRILELTYTSEDLKDFALELGYDNKPFKKDFERTLLLQAELDAIFAHMYHIKRDQLEFILEFKFKRIKRKELEEFKEYKTKKFILKAYDKFKI